MHLNYNEKKRKKSASSWTEKQLQVYFAIFPKLLLERDLISFGRDSGQNQFQLKEDQ